MWAHSNEVSLLEFIPASNFSERPRILPHNNLRETLGIDVVMDPTIYIHRLVVATRIHSLGRRNISSLRGEIRRIMHDNRNELKTGIWRKWTISFRDCNGDVKWAVAVKMDSMEPVHAGKHLKLWTALGREACQQGFQDVVVESDLTVVIQAINYYPRCVDWEIHETIGDIPCMTWWSG